MKNRAVRICAIVMAIYLALGVAFYFIAGDSLHFTSNTSDSVSAKDHVGEILAGSTVEQSFVCEFDTLTSFSLTFGTFKRANEDLLNVSIISSDENGAETVYPIDTPTVETAYFENPETDFVITQIIQLVEPVQDALGKTFTVRIESTKGTPGNAVTLYHGNAIDMLRGSAPVDIPENGGAHLNGVAVTDLDGAPSMLCMTTRGNNNHWFGNYYWWFYAGFSVLVALALLHALYCYKNGKKHLILGVVLSIRKYNFLIRQLVARDFKTKYKRSVLGVLWSFLNPLLTMGIQYVIFSTLFGNDIAHFPIYLLSGIVCFNFFSEAASMCLMSIVGNSALINKVYVPKYIYPFSRTLSSCINLALSMVPLLIMMLIEQTPITPALLLLPFVFLMLFMLSYGMGLILATLMVFFRDTQFLWGIVSMLLMYLTPIFYSDSIIPDWFMPIYKLNPLYHILRFIRSILIDGVSLEPKAYLLCIVLCSIPLLLGLLIFHKKQNKFIFNI